MKGFVDEVRQRGHFFLRRKLPWPRPTRDGCTALEAMCCLVDAADRGGLLDELSLEADDGFAPDAAEFAVAAAFEFAPEAPPETLVEPAPLLVDESDSPAGFEVDAPSRVAPPLAPLVLESDFASDFAAPVAEVVEALEVAALEDSCEAFCED